MSRLIAIVGPTAVGKTEYSIRLAEHVGGEIVNADSRQVYRYMEIGTAKPTIKERAQVPHHLFDIVDPDEEFSISHYQTSAVDTINEIHMRGTLPILVGGSGQYVWSVIEGWDIPNVAPDQKIRKELENKAIEKGSDALYQELVEIDPESAEVIDPRNMRRIIRAVEVYRATGRRFSTLKTKTLPEYDVQIIGITMERKSLYSRIDRRVDHMIRAGFVDEVEGLRDNGYSFDLPSMSSLGYREIGRFINGETTLEGAVQEIKYATHRFARHQYSWFKLSDSRISWIELKDNNIIE